MIDLKSELHLQSLIFQWFYNSFPEYRIPGKSKAPRCLMIHNFNNPRSVVQGAKYQAAGLTSGVPDLTILVPNKHYHGMFIELKLRDAKQTDSQIEFMRVLKEKNYYCIVTNNLEDAKAYILDYLSD